MRPLHLEIRGIGPFAGEEHVPFDRLSEGGLYLITGDTGAGKTTIFDAVCFALFGEVSGEVRESGTLRSDYAVPGQDSQVIFCFEQNGQEYVVSRNPAYERPKQRGKGTAKQLAGAQLTLPDGTIMDGEREVTRRVEEILGLDRSQFKQMAMIAQGEFLKLLLANTKDRSAIFRKIFGTGLYSDLQERLRQEAAEWKKRCEETERSIRQYLNDIQLEPEGQENCPQTVTLRELLGRAGLDEAEQIPGLMEEWLSKQRQQLQTIEQNAMVWQQKSQKVTEALTRVEQENKQRHQWLYEQERYSQYKEQESAWQQEEQFLDRADRVERVCRPLWQQRRDAQWSLQRQDSLLQKKRQEKKVLDEALPALLLAKEQAMEQEPTRQAMREQLVTRKAELPGRKALVQQLTQRQRQKMAAEQAVTGMEGAYLHQEQRYRQKTSFYMECQQMFLRQQAGVLASRLQEGVACPVCGSLEHPSPAYLEDRVMEESQVQKAQEEMNEAQESLRTLGAQLQSQRMLADQLKLQCLEILGQLDGWNEEQIRQEEAEIRQEEQRLRTQEQKAAQIVREYEECQRKLLPLEGELDNQASQVQAAKVAVDAAEAAWQAGLVQENLADEEEYSRYVLESTEKARRKKACQTYRETGSKLAGSLQKLRELVEEAEKERKNGGYEQLIIGIMGVDAVEMKEELSGEELEHVLRQADYTLTQARNRSDHSRAVLHQRIVTNERVNGQLQKQMEKRRQQMTKWELYADLDRTAGGNLKGQERLALEQYVQAFYFDQIVERANRRFHEMSGGRYQLGRRHEASNRRSMAGLELEVMDYYTGKCRPVASLSGGEAFQASLSLALGMSDVVQSMAGGIRVEAMFVDEGFGSLDREAMDLAVSTLKGLAEDNFLVGIISHVEELKERIEQKILVEKGTEGSHIRLL